MISIKSLNKYFNKGKSNEIHVINDINLELPEKGMVAIFGKSGCGKTTLLNAIGGLDKTESGSIVIDGQNINTDTDTIRNQYVGYIFQNYNLNKSETCFDNVADALRLCGVTDNEVIETRVMAALRNVDMEQYKKRTPDTLSGGQQQRIAIARAIVKNPRIILADEPTGNLDELNTVMIMDLLKQISRDHLVLLVTHEANLVDFYCDKVIELSDGKVINVRENESAEGYNAKNKNHIYLGELEKTETATDKINLEYYGDAPETPIDLRIVNQNGKTYIEIRTPKVQILDSSSEVKLKEGVFEHKQSASKEKNIDMTELPPLKGSNFGKLFNFRFSIISGYNSCFSKTKRMNKIMRATLFLFSVVLVFMSASLGRSFGDLEKIKDSYNHSIFYVYSPVDSDISKEINAAIGTNGIDYIGTRYYYPYQEETFYFNPVKFETYDSYTRLSSNAVIVGTSLMKDLPLLTGRNTELSKNDVVITSAVADKLLKNSPLEYINQYNDLIGLKDENGGYTIVGIVKSNDYLIFRDDYYVAKSAYSQFNHKVESNAKFPIEIEKGTVTLVLAVANGSYGDNFPSLNETVMINGESFKVTNVLENYESYGEYIAAKGYSYDYNRKPVDYYSYLEEQMQTKYPNIKPDSHEYDIKYQELYETLALQFYESFSEYEIPFDIDFYINYLVLKENSNIKFSSEEFHEKHSEYLNNRYYEFYQKYFSKLDEYVQMRHLMFPTRDSWLAYEKNLLEHKLDLAATNGYAVIYYNAIKAIEKGDPLPKYTFDDLYSYYENLNNAFEDYPDYSPEYSFGSAFYVMNAEDYISMSKRFGETDKSVNDYYYEYVAPEYEKYSAPTNYTVIHSSSPEETKRFLNEKFPDHTTGKEETGYQAIVSPDSMFEYYFNDKKIEIISNIISMAAMLGVMSFCMYFIMRSVLMGRIKEIGIYRAIGVSKKNLLFRFVTESLVLTTLTVFIGYAFTSGLMFAWIGSSSMMETVFYYPIWLAALLLVFIYSICILCGTMPVASLLRKTPSEILAKYDI